MQNETLMPVNALEKAVLQAVCQSALNVADLEAQLKGVLARSRENTGVGFYTKLQPNGAAKSIRNEVIGGVFAKIKGLENPMTFVLYIHNGYVDILEGAATEGCTTEIDFSRVEFELL